MSIVQVSDAEASRKEGKIYLLSIYLHYSVWLYTIISVDRLPLERWRANLSTSFEDLSFVVCSTTLSETPKYLVCFPNTLHNHPPADVREIWKNDTRTEFDRDQAVNGKL